MSTAPFFVGVDVGGQTIKGGVVDDTGRPLSAVSVPTEALKGQEHGLDQMCRAVRDAVAEARMALEQINAIGVATPGTMDIPAGMILDPPNLKPWRNVPVRQHIRDQFGKPTAFQNDANAAAYGEYWVGAGQGTRSMVLFTLGTGIGCGIIINDFILEGEHSHGAEVGHIIIHTPPLFPPSKGGDTGGVRMCGCGQPGHLEAYASAIAIAKRASEALAKDRRRSRLHQIAKDKELQPDQVDEIFDAAAQGDKLAEKIVDETAYYLAIGAVNMMHTINPDMVVFGGGMTAAGEPFLDRIRAYVKKLAFPVPAEKTTICYAKLGNDAGFIGAAACARQLCLRGK